MGVGTIQAGGGASEGGLKVGEDEGNERREDESEGKIQVETM